MLNVFMLSTLVLSVVMLGVVYLNVMATPSQAFSDKNELFLNSGSQNLRSIKTSDFAWTVTSFVTVWELESGPM
jgi:hypothetical protein